MASLRRSNALSPDGQTARFLYTILKQLDLKHIDWSLVAESLDITNGHAARMRFSRFKQHMEGVPPQSRAPRARKDTNKSGKGAKGKSGKTTFDDEAEEDLKMEGHDAATLKAEPAVPIKPELVLQIKVDPDLDLSNNQISGLPTPSIKTESMT